MRNRCAILLALSMVFPAGPAELDVSQLKPEGVKKGVAVLEDGPDFLRAFESATHPASSSMASSWVR